MLSRCDFLFSTAGGFGGLALSQLLAAEGAKGVPRIHSFFMNLRGRLTRLGSSPLRVDAAALCADCTCERKCEKPSEVPTNLQAKATRPKKKNSPAPPENA